MPPARRFVLPLAALTACPEIELPLSTGTETTATPSTGESEPTSTSTTDIVPTSTSDATSTTVDPTSTSVTSDSSSSGDESTTGTPACTSFQCGAPAACCAPDEACVAGACAPACPGDVRCGPDLATCCAEGEVCIGEACAAPGADCTDTSDCPPSNYCEPQISKCIPLPDPLECTYSPADLTVALEWEFIEDEFTTMPLVVDLDGDGTPEVVANSTRSADNPADYSFGELIALDGATGEELWRIPHDPINNQFGAHGRTTLGAGDVSGDGLPDIIYPGRPEPMNNFVSAIHAVDGTGALLWTSRNPNNTTAKVRVMNGAPALANLDDDPEAEIAYGAAVYDHDGLLVWNQNNNGGVLGSPHAKNMPSALLYSGGIATFVDLTADGYPELLTGNTAWSIDWTPGDPPAVTLTALWKDTSGFAGDGWPAVADLDDNGTPEVVLVAWPEIKVLDGATGKLWCGVDPSGTECANNDAIRTPPIDIPGGNLGGPATIADFDGDGRPEFGMTTGSAYYLFDLHREGEQIVQPPGDPPPPPGTIYARWKNPVKDPSSASTGSSAFDFDADGAVEAVYQDECVVRVYDGASGEVRLAIPSSTATIHEYPVLRDVDGDGKTELLVVANLSDPMANDVCMLDDPTWSPRKGVYLYRPAGADWAATSGPWTMHSYHVTNVDPNGNPPLSEQDHWAVPDLNGFRESEPGPVAPQNAPDLTVSLAADLAQCPTTHLLRATVFNNGSLGVPAGIDVTFHIGTDASGTPVATVPTSVPLVPGGFTVVETTTPAPPADEPANYFAIVDPGESLGECFEANNGALLFAAACPP